MPRERPAAAFRQDCSSTRAFFALCLEESGGGALPVSFFLDEFGNLGKVHELASVVTTLRKRRCSVSPILQELSQLDAVYGRNEARTIFAGGCANKLFFSGLNLGTSRSIEGMLGSNTEFDTLFGGVDERARTIGVPLMRSDRVRMLRGRQAVLISGSERPVRVKMPPYFAVGAWNRLAAKPPAAASQAADSGPVPLVDLQRNQLLPTVAAK